MRTPATDGGRGWPMAAQGLREPRPTRAEGGVARAAPPVWRLHVRRPMALATAAEPPHGTPAFDPCNAGHAYYATPSAVTDVARHAGRLTDLPTTLPELRRVAHGLIVHPVHAHRYGIAPGALRMDEARIHPAASMLDRILALDDSPLTTPRPPARRMVGNCGHVAILTVAFLRHLGIPARARVGFCNYYLHGRSHDHAVVEVWSAERERWVLIDPLLDEVLGTDPDYPIDLLDVSRERFWVAGQAWERCRAGRANPWTFGYRGRWGLWYVRANLLRDLAALNKLELLPGDVWALSEKPDDVLEPWELSLLDVAAASTQRTDAPAVAACRLLYETTPPLQVPRTFRRWVGDDVESVDLATIEAQRRTAASQAYGG